MTKVEVLVFTIAVAVQAAIVVAAYHQPEETMASFTVRVFYSTPTIASPKELTRVVEAASVVGAIDKVLAQLSDKNRVIYLTARAESDRKAKFPDSATPPPQIGRFPGIVP